MTLADTHLTKVIIFLLLYYFYTNMAMLWGILNVL